MCDATMYRTQRINGHSMFSIRISASCGVRAPVTHVASGETAMRQRANAIYDGMSATLKATTRAPGCAVVHAASSIQNSTTGTAAAPQTIASTRMMSSRVQPIRHAAPAFQRWRRAEGLVTRTIL